MMLPGTIMHSESGIAEALDGVIHPVYEQIVILGTFAVVFFAVYAILFWLTKNINSTPIILSIIGVTVVAMFGAMFGILNFTEKTRELVDERTFENIQENYAIDQLETENVGRYDEENRTQVYGVSDGKLLEFEVRYHTEHDLMMPVYGIENSIEVPVQEGSALEALITMSDTSSSP